MQDRGRWSEEWAEAPDSDVCLTLREERGKGLAARKGVSLQRSVGVLANAMGSSRAAPGQEGASAGVPKGSARPLVGSSPGEVWSQCDAMMDSRGR